MDKDEVRSMMLEVLSDHQFIDMDVGIINAVAEKAVMRGLIPRPTQHYQPSLPPSDWAACRDALWELMIEGLVRPGGNSSNASWSWVSLTEYGQQCINAGEILPHDPGRYLTALEQASPLDDLERRYVRQALAAYHRHLPDASAVMLGCASEHLLLVLADEVRRAGIGGAGLTKKMKGPALQLLDYLRGVLTGVSGSMPRRLRERLLTVFVAVADTIRVSRNDAGHPELNQISRDDCFVLLRLYREYRYWVFGVMDWLSAGMPTT